MGINNTLFREVEPYLYKYGCSYNEIQNFLFLNKGFVGRQEKAIQIIDDIMTTHGKEDLLNYVTQLAKVEQGIQELQPWVRDHVVHALLSFILGIYINEKFLSKNNGQKVTPFQWKLAGLLHDVGYPVEIARNIINPYTNTINVIRRKLGVEGADIKINIVPVNLDLLHNNKNGFTLIQNCLNQWGLSINARDEFDRMVDDGKICHGILSALSVLNIVDSMYQRYNRFRGYQDTYKDNININWNQHNFENEVVPACSAIFIHNLRGDRFDIHKIDPNVAPLAFLLKLSDTLQEWERPSEENPIGYSNEIFDIMCDQSLNLIFTSADIKIKKKIQVDINNTIHCNKILLQ